MENTHLVPPALLLPNSGPCLSLYYNLTPEHRHADVIRLQTLVAQARKLLGNRSPPLGEEQTLALIEPLLSLFGSDALWQDKRSTRAVFIAPGFFSEVFLSHHVDDTVRVGSEFQIRPLLAPPAAGRYFVLALHSDRVQLFEGDENGMHPSQLGLPTFEKACTHNFSTGKNGLDHATSISCDHAHPRGSGDIKHARIKAYYSIIACLFHAQFPSTHQPVILVGTTRNIALFKTVTNKLPALEIQSLTMDPDSLPLAALERQVLTVALPYLGREWKESLGRLQDRKANIPIERELASIVESAHKGQIETLWLARGAQARGMIDSSGVPVVHPIAAPLNEDLLNLAAIQVLRHRGHVYEVESDQLEPGIRAIATLRFVTDRYHNEAPMASAVNGHVS